MVRIISGLKSDHFKSELFWQFNHLYWFWVFKIVAVSCGYDTCFSVKACDGLHQLLKFIGSDWNTNGVKIDCVDLCQTHWKQVPDFSRPSGSEQASTRSLPPVPAFGSIWVVLWLLFFKSAPFTFPSEIGQIHLSIEAQFKYSYGWPPQISWRIIAKLVGLGGGGWRKLKWSL